MCFVSVFMNYFDNPGGMIPAWLVNWAAKVSVTGLHTTSESCNHWQLHTHDGSVLAEQTGHMQRIISAGISEVWPGAQSRSAVDEQQVTLASFLDTGGISCDLGIIIPQVAQ